MRTRTQIHHVKNNSDDPETIEEVVNDWIKTMEHLPNKDFVLISINYSSNVIEVHGKLKTFHFVIIVFQLIQKGG